MTNEETLACCMVCGTIKPATSMRYILLTGFLIVSGRRYNAGDCTCSSHLETAKHIGGAS